MQYCRKTNEHFGTAAAVKAMLRLVLETHSCNASTYFSLPSGVCVCVGGDENKTVTFTTKKKEERKKENESLIPKAIELCYFGGHFI